jgi:hypothetical protein
VHRTAASSGSGGSSGEKEHVKELRELLRNESGAERRAALQSELAAVQQGAAQRRLAALKTKPVVGVTLASAGCAALDEQQFSIVFLDETSQQVEPHSLVAIARFGVECLLLAGDPLQLPPPLHNCFGEAERTLAATAGLGRTLFDRMAQLDATRVVMLRTQYRCHATLAGIANRLFYESRLIDGAPPPLVARSVERLATLTFCDVRGGREASSGGAQGASYTNAAEAAVVLHLLRLLARAGVDDSRIGVICWYKAQAALLQSQLDERRVVATRQRDAAIVDDLDQLDDLCDILGTDPLLRCATSGQLESQNANVHDVDDDNDTAADDDDDRIDNDSDEQQNDDDDDDDDDGASVHIGTVDGNHAHICIVFCCAFKLLFFVLFSAFQGAERDIIIMATTRTESLGFLGAKVCACRRFVL